MKYFELLKVSDYFKQFNHISSIVRVDDNILQIKFDKNKNVYINLRKSNSSIFMCNDFFISKTYQAPFDIALFKRFYKSKIESIEVLKNNRVLKVKVFQESGYKVTNSILLLEFTGRNTNAIILDENGIVIEALRHIDKSVSYRSVKVGEGLLELPDYTIKENIKDIGDVEEFLYQTYQTYQNANLENLKTQKRFALQKKIDKIDSILATLEDKDELLKEADTLSKKASLLLANKYNLNDYDKDITLFDFDGNIINIKIEDEYNSIQHAIDSYFQKNKKLKQRAKSLYKEKENLTEKKDLLQRLSLLIKEAKSINEVNILSPKQNLKNKKQKDSDAYLNFFLDDFKIMVGKNEKGNVDLLKLAKKNDIWLHVKDIPSAHVIVKTNKLELPKNVLEFAAKLCVNLSNLNSGDYIVDYTQRGNVKPEIKANVTYTNYKSIKIAKE